MLSRFLRFSMGVGRFGGWLSVGIGRFGVGVGRFGVSVGRFGMSIGRFGISIGWLGVSVSGWFFGLLHWLTDWRRFGVRVSGWSVCGRSRLGRKILAAKLRRT